MKPVIIIPAFKPDLKLIKLVSRIKYLSDADQHIVIIDDGSGQEYAGIFEKLKSNYCCDLCIHEKNAGKGAALKTGIEFAAKKYPEACGYVTADADGQHAPEDILKVAGALMRYKDHLILGVRDFHSEIVPFKSKWGNRITSGVYQLSTGLKCPDTQTGLRGIPSEYAQFCLTVPGVRYEYEMNLLTEMGSMGVPFSYVPIKTIYLENNRSSHFHPFRDSVIVYYNILKYMLKCGLSSLSSSIVDLSLFTIFTRLVFGAGYGGVLAATVFARLLSGCFNFMLNKHWVFRSPDSHSLEAAKYFTLFCFQMLTSWLLVAGLSRLAINITLLKMIVDVTLFFISYQIQNQYVFKVKSKKRLANPNDKIFYKAL